MERLSSAAAPSFGHLLNGCEGNNVDGHDLRRALTGRDRRSIGRANEIADLLAANPDQFSELIKAIADDDPVVRMRAADVAEKMTRSRPMLLADHKATLLGPLLSIDQQEVRWHLLPLLSRLPLTPQEREQAFAFAMQCLESSSRIVAAEALSAAFGLARTNEDMQVRAAAAATRALESRSAALRARARKLLSGR